MTEGWWDRPYCPHCFFEVNPQKTKKSGTYGCPKCGKMFRMSKKMVPKYRCRKDTREVFDEEVKSR